MLSHASVFCCSNAKGPIDTFVALNCQTNVGTQTIAPQDRAVIARAAYETVGLMCVPSDFPGDDAMRVLLDEFGWSMAEEALA